jgi:hypothetical protein
MLLDLGRNDVGRVAAIGSMRVPASSASSATARSCTSPPRCAAASAPGWRRWTPGRRLPRRHPLRRAQGPRMEIIEELEPSRRGLYAGGLGYFGVDGNMDVCIALRTALVKDGTLHVQAGAGVVGRQRRPRRARGMHRQGCRPVPRRRGSGALRGHQPLTLSPQNLREILRGPRTGLHPGGWAPPRTAKPREGTRGGWDSCHGDLAC